MKAITLRKLPPQLAQFIEAKAAGDRTSLNQTVIKLLQEATGLDLPRIDVSKFAGAWTREEGEEFDRFLAEERRIDPRDRE
jgi:hypothetical protein